MFFVDRTGMVGKHKTHGSNLAGCGVLHPDQNVIIYTKNGNKYPFNFEGIKVGDHKTKQLVMLSAGDEVTKVDIVTDLEFVPEAT